MVKPRTHRSATLDFIAIVAIIFFTWPIVYATREAVVAPNFEATFRTVFNFILAYFAFYAYPILIIIINHISRLDEKRLVINILSIIELTYVIWKSIYMAIDRTGADLFVSIPLFIILWSIAPILILIINNKS